jgi:DNA adenine methylase
MPYILKKVKDGYKVCKKADKTECFSKEGIPKERAKKQMKAIEMSEHLEGTGPPIEMTLYDAHNSYIQTSHQGETFKEFIEDNNVKIIKANDNEMYVKDFIQMLRELQITDITYDSFKEDEKDRNQIMKAANTYGYTFYDYEGGLEGGLKPISARIGGKVLLKKKIVNTYFPRSSTYKTYVEPFVGGGSIYFYKNKDGHKEVINDLDPNIYKLFKGFQKYADDRLASDVNGDYTETDFKKIQNSQPASDYGKFLKTYLLYKLSYFGRGDNFGKPRINTKFPAYKERLANVTILNEDYKKVIEDYDSKDTFFYLDPPTTGQVGNFNFQPTDIAELAQICKKIKGKFLLSLANTKVKKVLFKGFTIKTIPTKYVGSKTKGGQSMKVNEYIIMNYNPDELSGSGGMDDFHKQLEKDSITHEMYMDAAGKAAKKNGYDSSKLEMASDGTHKLTYTTPEGKAVPFGRVSYNDFIIYTLTKNKDADKHRDAYRARATNIKGDWEKDKYSPNNLAINILW